MKRINSVYLPVVNVCFYTNRYVLCEYILVQQDTPSCNFIFSHVGFLKNIGCVTYNKKFKTICDTFNFYRLYLSRGAPNVLA